jgi:hypothetical protein
MPSRKAASALPLARLEASQVVPVSATAASAGRVELLQLLDRMDVTQQDQMLHAALAILGRKEVAPGVSDVVYELERGIAEEMAKAAVPVVRVGKR